LRIEDYAAIGDQHTVALVGIDGSMDWLCLPRFDSPSCFSALLGDEDGSRWRIGAVGEHTATRRYLPGSNVWWDVAPAEISADAPTQERRGAYEAERAKLQRFYY